ncbi:hypothetical protein GQ43DRAFT_338421, partial [Delitschia confertaspora ATCC 74209]
PLRHSSFTPNPPPNPSTSQPTSRLSRVNARLPRFLRRYTTPLLSAPLSHITSFLLLHELTAILPLFTLAGLFHYTSYLPPYFSEGKWVLVGVERFGNYFRRKGWISDSSQRESKREIEGGEVEGRRKRGKWDMTEGGVRVIVEFATAYAITKAILPLRIIFSVWATPWFAARAVIPMGRGIRNILGR